MYYCKILWCKGNIKNISFVLITFISVHDCSVFRTMYRCTYVFGILREPWISVCSALLSQTFQDKKCRLPKNFKQALQGRDSFLELWNICKPKKRSWSSWVCVWSWFRWRKSMSPVAFWYGAFVNARFVEEKTAKWDFVFASRKKALL